MSQTAEDLYMECKKIREALLNGTLSARDANAASSLIKAQCRVVKTGLDAIKTAGVRNKIAGFLE